MSHFKAKMHQIHFRLGLRPDRTGGAHSALPDPLAVMLSPRGQAGLEAKILSSASKICPRPRPQPRTIVLGLSSNFLFCPRENVCKGNYGRKSDSRTRYFPSTWTLISELCSKGLTSQRLYCIIILYVIFGFRKFVLGLGLMALASASTSASKVCRRPWPRPRRFVLGLDLGLKKLSSFNITGFKGVLLLRDGEGKEREEGREGQREGGKGRGEVASWLLGGWTPLSNLIARQQCGVF